MTPAGLKALQFRRSLRRVTDTHRTAEGFRRQIPQTARGLGKLREISTGLKGKDANDKAGETDRTFRAQRADRIYVSDFSVNLSAITFKR
jgi:hypothetical protein